MGAWSALEQATYVSVARRSPRGHESCAWDVADVLMVTEAEVQVALDELVRRDVLVVAGSYRGHWTYQVGGITVHDALTYEEARRSGHTEVQEALSTRYGLRGSPEELQRFSRALAAARFVQSLDPRRVLREVR